MEEDIGLEDEQWALILGEKQLSWQNRDRGLKTLFKGIKISNKRIKMNWEPLTFPELFQLVVAY